MLSYVTLTGSIWLLVYNVYTTYSLFIYYGYSPYCNPSQCGWVLYISMFTHFYMLLLLPSRTRRQSDSWRTTTLFPQQQPPYFDRLTDHTAHIPLTAHSPYSTYVNPPRTHVLLMLSVLCSVITILLWDGPDQDQPIFYWLVRHVKCGHNLTKLGSMLTPAYCVVSFRYF